MAGLTVMQIVVLIDALGWQLIKDCPFLSEELRFRTPLKTVLGFSSGAIPSLLTGRTPAVTGRWNLLYFDPNNSPFRWLRMLSWLPDAVLDNRYSRKAIKELGRRVLGMGSLFECGVSPRLLPWFNWSERTNIYAAGGINGSRSIFDLLNQCGVPHRIYSYHTLSDMQILERAKTDISSGSASFFFLYLSEVDHFLHANCSELKSVTQRLHWYEEQLRLIFQIAMQRDPGMTFTVISDHGMTPVHSQYDLVGEIERLEHRMPQEYLAVYDSTMARYWFFDSAARRTITDRLEQMRCGRILSEVELDELGILFPDRRYGELIFLLNPGWLIAQSNFNGGGWNPTGMHGYHPSDPDSDAIFLSNHAPQRPLTSIIDIYSVVEEAIVTQ